MILMTHMTYLTYLTFTNTITPTAIATGYQKLKSPIFAAPYNYWDT